MFLFPLQAASSLSWLMLNLRQTKTSWSFLCELQSSQVSLILLLCNWFLEPAFKTLDLLMLNFIWLLLTQHSQLSRSSWTLILSSPPALSHLQIWCTCFPCLHPNCCLKRAIYIDKNRDRYTGCYTDQEGNLRAGWTRGCYLMGSRGSWPLPSI